jgi:hypothetical protein
MHGVTRWGSARASRAAMATTMAGLSRNVSSSVTFLDNFSHYDLSLSKSTFEPSDPMLESICDSR